MLHIHRAERADRLAGGLAETLLEPLEDPFTADVVAVPTRGIERWLAQCLSTRLGAAAAGADGVCANVEFPFPGRLVRGALAAATGVDPDVDPWLADRSVWPLLETVDECLEEPWLEMLAVHVAGVGPDGEEQARRFAVVRHLADLFDRYGIHRPDMVTGWADGADGPDGEWQAELWRRLRARLGRPSPAERLSSACERIREQPDLLDLPPRLSLFGLTRMPRSYLEVLAAIASGRDVHLFVLHPSSALWTRVAGALAAEGPVIERRHDRTAFLAANRLLASWGRDARELQLVLQTAGASSEHHHGLDAPSDTLLGRIQADIRADRQPPGPPLPDQPDVRPALDAEDHSVQVHACHGRARQVEVLRDALLHALEQDPTLEPRDVIVMCPDIETFAPLIHATFGAGRVTSDDAPDTADAGAPPAAKSLPDLRVRLADRSLRQTNPVLERGRPAARSRRSADHRLAAPRPGRSRSRCAGASASTTTTSRGCRTGSVDSGIRWGLDAEHRAPFKLDDTRGQHVARGPRPDSRSEWR